MSSARWQSLVRPLYLGLSALCLLPVGCGGPPEEVPQVMPTLPPPTPQGPSSGVCGFTAPVQLDPPGADGFVDIPANHPNIHYYGRLDCTDPAAPAFAYPAVTIRARFVGDGLDLKLTDHGNGGVQSTNYYDVIIDGGMPTVLQVSPMTQIYPLARNLPPGEHSLELVKRTESGAGSGKGEFRGLRLHGGDTLLPVPAHAHRIEFVGDSITCGYGDEVSTNMPDKAPYTTQASNARLAFSAVAARALDADNMTVAYSGRGMYRNYAGQPGLPMPALYLRSLPDDDKAAPWSPATAVPEVLVINLGTNDFSPGGVDRAQFRAAYIDFLTRLRSYYPQALFVLTAGPMLSDSYPPGEKAWSSIREDIGTVIDTQKAAGDKNLLSLFFAPQSGPWGEDYHPTVATHQAMADQLVELLRPPTR